MAANVWRFCKERSVSGRTVTLKVKYADVQIITRCKTVQLPIRSETELRGLAPGLMEATFPTPKGIRLLGVTLSSLVNDFDGEELQLSVSLRDGGQARAVPFATDGGEFICRCGNVLRFSHPSKIS
ncbi:hypothetical protein [Pelagibacterium sp. H642]|uniref:DinB/UmuC family translesion DNA polymerase n=1 Tax=Pelagibacterium sp. H642 TaxID=1881069 RepID=UPI0035C1AF25